MDKSPQSNSTPNATSITTTKPTGSFQFPDLNGVKTPGEINRKGRILRLQEDKLHGEFVFTEKTFLSALQHYASFDILTFTIASIPLFSSRHIKRLIYGVGNPPTNTKASIQLTHTHAKIWICYHRMPHHVPDVYLGSANATDMTLLELVVKTNAVQARELTKYFDLLWEDNYKTK
jgi:hypothetical protein